MARTIGTAVSGSATDAIASRRIVTSDSEGLKYPSADSDAVLGVSLEYGDGGEYISVAGVGEEVLLDVSGSVSQGDLIARQGTEGRGQAVTPATYVGWVVGQANQASIGSGTDAKCFITVDPMYLSGSGA